MFRQQQNKKNITTFVKKTLCCIIIVTLAFATPLAAFESGYNVGFTSVYSQSNYRYGRTKLENKSQRYIYDTLLKSIKLNKKTITFNTKKYILSKKNYDYAELAFSNDYPEYDYCEITSYSIDDKNKIKTLFLKYYAPIKNKKKELDKAIDSIIKGIPETCTSDYEKALYLHDYLCQHVEYQEDYSKWCYSAYGALLKGKCVCDGYAKAYYLLLLRAGIKVWKVHGYALNDYGTLDDSSGHAWNIIWIDGECFYVDATWDDSSDSTVVSHNYFCKSQKTMNTSHKILFSLDKKGFKYQNQFQQKSIPNCNHDESKYLPPNVLRLKDPLHNGLYDVIESKFSQVYPFYDSDDNTQKYARSIELYYDGKEDLTKWLESNVLSAGFKGDIWYGIDKNGNMYRYEIIGLHKPYV